jgi:hypothetical protein
VDFDGVGNVGETQDRVSASVAAGDPDAVEGHRFEQRRADRLRIPPSVWFLIPSRFTASPLSIAATARSTRTLPVSRCISSATAS